MREHFDAFLDLIGVRKPWHPLPRWAVAAWLIFYLWFLAYAYSKHGGFLFIDTANMVVHEGGHALYGWFGSTIGLWGGTLLQWQVPFFLACYFFYHRKFASFIFCAFFFFENWIYTATYMADARAMVLPLVTIGDPENAKHDWNTIFGGLGILDYDTAIAAIVRFCGWAGMIGCTAWLASRLRDGIRGAEMDDKEREFNNRFLQSLGKGSKSETGKPIKF